MAKLVIKLKVAGEGGDATDKNLISCPICDKKFKSGKAYGGHKRKHTLNIKKEKEPIELIDLIIDDSLPRYSKCSLCPKTFRTKKSFEQHVETHQQRRQCEDLMPPTPESTVPSSSSTVLVPKEEDQVDMEIGEKRKFADLPRELPPTWSRTGRRGQNGRAIICLPSSEEVYQVANDLMLLSIGDARAEILPPKKRRIYWPGPKEMPKTDADLKGKGKSLESVENAGGNDIVFQKPFGGYVCHKCNKSFGSYQALGGHNSHHKKEVGPEFTEQFSIDARLKYKCPLCNKGFLSSQGLGGHRRRCKELAPLTRVVLEEKAKETIAEVPQKTFSFDLNELPPPEEDEKEMEGTNMLQQPEKILRLTWHGDGECLASSSTYPGQEH